MDNVDANGRGPDDGRVKPVPSSSVGFKKDDGSSLRLRPGHPGLCVGVLVFPVSQSYQCYLDESRLFRP